MKYSCRLSTLSTSILLISIGSTSLAAPPEVTELIVRFKDDQSAIEMPRAFSYNQENALAKQPMQKASAYSQKIRPLIRPHSKQSKSALARAQAIAKPKKKGLREELEEYVVLSYPNRQALEAAKAALENDPNVLWVGENALLEPLVTPSDPLYKKPTVVIGPGGPRDVDYQWAMQALNMSEVWNFSKGHAYIAEVDSGIELGHPDLQSNFRSHFSYDYGDDDNNVDELVSAAQGAGHGTHVAGILAATVDNATGVAGICWNCSLMVGKMAHSTSTYPVFTIDRVIKAITGMVDTGAQVINMSFGGTTDFCDGEDISNKDNIVNPYCKAIAYAESMDVVMAAASGNESNQHVDFPARHPDVIGVGAIDSNLNKTVWSSFGPGMELDIVAPGEHILSTFYTNYDWVIAYPPGQHVDDFRPDCGDSVSAPPGYGPCSGTSMSTPHVSGIVSILRSVNPLLSNDQIRDLLTSHASQATNPDPQLGYGIPDVLASVKAALGSAKGQVLPNRLTPLFSLINTTSNDHFYTTAPQMAMSAMYESLKPQPPNATVSWTPYGNKYVPGYSDFPRPASWWFERPKASVYIFTTYRNPFNPENNLVPLYRLSYQGNTTGTNALNLDHVYTTEQAGIDAFETVGYHLDGIEGYIFPNYEPQPPGTVKLYRKYNSDLDDHAIFPETELADMTAQGYTIDDGKAVIGYVYPNIDSDSDGLIDGFEEIIGTDSFNPDSDYDGIADGTEVNNYPYSDPKDLIASPVFSQMTPDAVTQKWYLLDLAVSFSDVPVLLSQIQTFDGGDTASLRMRTATEQSVELRIEEEQSRDTETAHTTEVIGLLGIEPGDVVDSSGDIIGEAGFVTSNTTGDTNWRTLTFSRSYTNPIVVMNMITTNGGQPSHIRLNNITTTDVKYQIEEWEYLDQPHTTETMAYIVLEQGNYTLADAKQLRTGLASVNHQWQQVNFTDLGATPVIFTQCQTYNEKQAVVTRQRNARSDGFEVRLQEEEANGSHQMESVGYIAVQ